jgi:uncharacterized protein
MTNDIPRYCPQRPLPPYSYVPGLFPHPTSDARGHSYGVLEPACAPLDESNYRANATYLHAIDLFNHGFYWEAHEAWEALWHAAGRRGRIADFLKGLIKLAAAGVKLREGRPAGVRQHALRAAKLLRGAQSASGSQMFGIDISYLLGTAEPIATRAEEMVGDAQPSAERRLPLVIEFGE